MSFTEENRGEVRAAVRFLYDIQRLRIQASGRGLQHEAGKKVDLMPGQLGYMDGLTGRLKTLENEAEAHVAALCVSHPMNAWLREIKGIGPRMAGVILSEIDIHRAPTVSALWRYCGLSVTPDEEGVMHAERRTKGQKLAYNSFLKTKLVKVLSDSFIKQRTPIYRDFYDHYKHRLETKDWGKSKGHRDNAARRYMIKMFLKDAWETWRLTEGLPVRPSYAEEYLAKKHHDKEARA